MSDIEILTKDELEERKILIKQFPLRLLIDLLCYRGGTSLQSQSEIPQEEWEFLCGLVSGLDKKEFYCHVEYPDETRLDQMPVIWRKNEWAISYERHQRVKRTSEQGRARNAFFLDKINELTKAIERDTGLDSEMSETLARGIIMHKDAEKRRKKARAFGVDVEYKESEE